MPRYVAARYGDQRRYLLKGLREMAHRVADLVAGLDPGTLTARPVDLDEEWCVQELVGFLRDSEREDLRAIEAMLRRDGARLEPRRAQYGPLEHDYRSESVEQLMWEFFEAREEVVWTLRDDPDVWQRTGRDPVRGEVTMLRHVQEMHERDLDAMWRIQRIAGRLAPPRSRQQV